MYLRICFRITEYNFVISCIQGPILETTQLMFVIAMHKTTTYKYKWSSFTNIVGTWYVYKNIEPPMTD